MIVELEAETRTAQLWLRTDGKLATKLGRNGCSGQRKSLIQCVMSTWLVGARCPVSEVP